MYEKDLDQILSLRAFEEPSADFSQRIIASVDKGPIVELWYQRITDLFIELVLPRPVYAFSFALIIGFIIGFNDSSLLANYNSVDLGEYLYNEGVLL